MSTAYALDHGAFDDAEAVAPPAPPASPQRRAILDPGLDLTLRPMRYPEFYERYRQAIRNTWTVEEIDFSDDVVDLHGSLLSSERHLIRRLVAFFATGDSIVANNLVLNLYKHINAPEARLFLSRQLYEEALHVQFYLTLLDTYLPDHAERAEAFRAVETIPSIRAKAEFCFRWMSSIGELDELRTREDRRTFLLNLICFAACIEGLFFFGAFAYVYFLRSKGLLNGLAAGTNWVFRDESGHMDFAFAVVDTVRAEEPDLFDDELSREIVAMIEEAVEAEMVFVAGHAVGGRARPVGRRHARVPAVRRRPAPGAPRVAAALRVAQPVRVHGAAGRAGAVELLRAHRLGVPGRRLRRRRLRPRLLISTSKFVQICTISRPRIASCASSSRVATCPGAGSTGTPTSTSACRSGATRSGWCRGDAPSAQWALDVAVVGTAGDRDFRGPAVQGKRGERFVYLTWGDVAADGAFAMFRRAKLMLADVDARLLDAARARRSRPRRDGRSQRRARRAALRPGPRAGDRVVARRPISARGLTSSSLEPAH